MSEKWTGTLEKIDDYRWRIPSRYKPCMRSEGILYASEDMLAAITSDASPEQVANVACLPGIVGPSLAMPDIHYGYGFPIGGVAAFDPQEGVVSPGGVGYDINCGVRLLRTDLDRQEVAPRLKQLVDQIFRDVPSGVGSQGRIRISASELNRVLEKGAGWAVANGYGWREDLERIEDGGCLPDAGADRVSERAISRGRPQLGTLGAGNHFLEIQVVDQILDQQAAQVFGIDHQDQITVMVHCGSRGLGYQVCDDYLLVMQKAMEKYHLSLPDRQLACAPLPSPEARDYLAAMKAAANYAFANRQCIAHWVREAFARVMGAPAERLGMRLIYDVCHNIAKFEQHRLNGEQKEVCVHRKGATRAFPPGHPDVPADYRKVGQPVLVPGDMGRCSYLLAGTEQAMADTFGSTCHGAGRLLSRHAAIRQGRGRDISQELADQGILVRAQSRGLLAEEMPDAYKNVDQVVQVCARAGISRPVARLRPIAVVKG